LLRGQLFPIREDLRTQRQDSAFNAPELSDRDRAVWRHPLHGDIPHFFYSMMKTYKKVEKIFPSHRHLRFVTAYRTPPIDSFKQHR
jgi:hypothetical protein